MALIQSKCIKYIDYKLPHESRHRPLSSLQPVLYLPEGDMVQYAWSFYHAISDSTLYIHVCVMQARIKFFHKKHIPDNDYNNVLYVNILSYVKIIIFEKSQVYTFMYVQTHMYR